MQLTASLAGEEVALEVDERCRSAAALKASVLKALPQLDLAGFDVVLGGRAVDDACVRCLEEGCRLEVVASKSATAVSELQAAGQYIDEDGLCNAAAAGDYYRCKLFLDAGVTLGCGTDALSRTPLHRAVQIGWLEGCTMLLDSGCAINCVSKHGSTPLHYAAERGFLDICKLLMARGCKVSPVDDHGDTPLDRAHLRVRYLFRRLRR